MLKFSFLLPSRDIPGRNIIAYTIKCEANEMYRFSILSWAQKLVPAVAVAALGACLLLVTSTADAASAGPQLLSRGTIVCLGVNHSKCLVTHGIGNDVTIQGSGYTNWSVFSTKIGSTTFYQFEDSQGHCLKAYSSGIVTIGTDICNPDNGNDDWVLSSLDPITMFNYGQQAYLGSVGDHDGNQVQVAQPFTGFYWHWHLSGPTLN